jgi:putative phosphotransacetylase
MAKNGKNKPLGERLIELGSLRADQIPTLLELQQRDAQANVQSKFGELCIRMGRTDPSQVNMALKRQKEEMIDQIEIGDMLISLGYVTDEQLRNLLKQHQDSPLPTEELVLDAGFCSPDQVRIATQLTQLVKNGLLRQQVESTFIPFNVMVLIVNELIDSIMEAAGSCRCSQCWSNVFAVTLNEVPPRYVSDHGRILDCLRRYREDYGELVRHTLARAVRIVEANPKSACRSRFSDDLLTGTDEATHVHEVAVHMSNRHIHLSREHVEALFGSDYELKSFKDLVQPGQFAACETVTIGGPKGEIDRVRVLGPERKETQVEISGTDQFILGIKVPVRESGDLEGTPGIRISGPAGQITTDRGAIRALRHIHMLPAQADSMGVQNGEKVSVRLVGDRSTICEGVLIRATDTSALEMHIDTDEANSAGLPAESMGQILVPVMNV